MCSVSLASSITRLLFTWEITVLTYCEASVHPTKGVRVPLIMHWLDRGKPGRTTVKGVRNELVTTLDLMPTFLEIAGAKPVVGLPGRSLVSMVEHNIDEWRRYLFTEFHTHSAHNFYPQRTIRDERYKLIHNLLPDEINPGYRFTVERFLAG